MSKIPAIAAKTLSDGCDALSAPTDHLLYPTPVMLAHLSGSRLYKVSFYPEIRPTCFCLAEHKLLQLLPPHCLCVDGQMSYRDRSWNPTSLPAAGTSRGRSRLLHFTFFLLLGTIIFAFSWM